MKIYIDSEFKCHTTNLDGTLREFDVWFFDGKCKEFVEGHIYIPPDETMPGPKGVVYQGGAIAFWKPYDELDAAQREYEKQLLKEYQENSIPLSDLEAAYQEGVNSV